MLGILSVSGMSSTRTTKGTFQRIGVPPSNDSRQTTFDPAPCSQLAFNCTHTVLSWHSSKNSF